MTRQKVKIPGLGLRGWTSLPYCKPGEVGRYSRWLNTGYDGLWLARGFKRYRLVSPVLSKPAYSWIHRHTDKTEWPIYFVDTELLPETGSDSPAAFKTGLTSSWAPNAVTFPDQGESVFFNNSANGEATVVRVVSAAPTDVLFDLAQPDTAWTATDVTSGGSLADGVYQVRIAQRDTVGNYTAQSEPAAVKTVTITGGGGSGSISVAQASWTPDARADEWRISITTVGTADAPAAYLHVQDVAIATTTKVITAQTANSTLQAFPDRNGVYQQATLPLTAVDFAVEHMGRMVIFSRQSNKAYFSERGQPNHFYSTSEINTTAETGWAGHCRCAASMGAALYVCTTNGVNIVTGSWRSDGGTNGTFTRDMAANPIDRNIGGVSHNAIDVIGNTAFFYSTLGPAIIRGTSVTPIEPYENVRVELDSVDTTYSERITSAEDPHNRYWCVAVPRKVNATRAMDGASVAGTPDLILRYDIPRGIWSIPLQMDVAHLSARENAGNNVTGGEGSAEAKVHLMAMSPNGYSLQLGYGTSCGGADDITGTIYDGALATSETTTTVVITQSGVTNDDYNGMLLVLFWPTVDTAYPGVFAIKTITDTAVSGSNVTITWAGGLPVGTSTKRTARVGGMPSWIDDGVDLSHYVNIPPGYEAVVHKATLELADAIGVEAVA